jgi:hypothetical protein
MLGIWIKRTPTTHLPTIREPQTALRCQISSRLNLRGAPMLGERPTPEINEPMDVVVLVVPDQSGLSPEFLEAIAEVRSRGDAAVLVVFPRAVGADAVLRAEAAGANHCAVAPASDELFTHIERARTLRRNTIVDAGALDSDPLDILWRTRSQSQGG